MTKTTKEQVEEFNEKKTELKDWLYGTIYKQYDTEETAEVVQSDVDDHFKEDWYCTELKEAEERGRREECEMVKRHIQEWDKISHNDAEYAERVRHYFNEIL